MRYNSCYAACGITGDPSPSEADLRLTRRLNEAARILQIQMLDHVIIGEPTNDRQGYFSFEVAPRSTSLFDRFGDDCRYRFAGRDRLFRRIAFDVGAIETVEIGFRWSNPALTNFVSRS